jgi:hypothetical protein
MRRRGVAPDIACRDDRIAMGTSGPLHAPEIIDLEILQVLRRLVAYVALAERIGCPLLTRDGRLARSTGHRARIERV